MLVTFAALAPALVNAFAINNMGPAMWIELCSAHGKKRIAVDGAGVPIAGIAASEDGSQSVAHMAEHCPFCHIEHAPAALPAASPIAVSHDTRQRALPACFCAAARPRFAWAAVRSRAPPTPS